MELEVDTSLHTMAQERTTHWWGGGAHTSVVGIILWYVVAAQVGAAQYMGGIHRIGLHSGGIGEGEGGLLIMGNPGKWIFNMGIHMILNDDINLEKRSDLTPVDWGNDMNVFEKEEKMKGIIKTS